MDIINYEHVASRSLCCDHMMMVQPNHLMKNHSPIVAMKVELKESSVYLSKMQVFPTPLSPITSILNLCLYITAIC